MYRISGSICIRIAGRCGFSHLKQYGLSCLLSVYGSLNYRWSFVFNISLVSIHSEKGPAWCQIKSKNQFLSNSSQFRLFLVRSIIATKCRWYNRLFTIIKHETFMRDEHPQKNPSLPVHLPLPTIVKKFIVVI